MFFCETKLLIHIIYKAAWYKILYILYKYYPLIFMQDKFKLYNILCI